MSFEFIETELGNFVEIVTKKCDASIIDVTNYISTENMLPDRQGVTLFHQASLMSTNLILLK